MKFEETYLNDNILDALYDMHFDEMTPIQERCIPEILDGYDVLGVAQTGTGKTAAYLLPILSLLDDGNICIPITQGKLIDKWQKKWEGLLLQERCLDQKEKDFKYFIHKFFCFIII